VDKNHRARRAGTQAINGTPKTIETPAAISDFQVLSDDVPAGGIRRGRVLPLRAFAEDLRGFAREGSLRKIFCEWEKM